MNKNKKVVFIIGGAKSGKSRFAIKKAEKVAGEKAFIATAEALDNEMRERIEKHKQVGHIVFNIYFKFLRYKVF